MSNMDNKRFLTSKEAAEYLDIPQATLMQLNSQRKITYYRCGKRCYYDINDIYAYITRVKIPAGSKKKIKTKHDKEEENIEPLSEEKAQPRHQYN